jgi:hypothetical protein
MVKKLKLEVEDLAVTSFAAEEERGGTGTVDGMQSGWACPTNLRPCTQAEGCYPSLYCTQDGPQQLTCAPDCMTNANGYC